MTTKTLVALDLETTGLDPQVDTVIEIGAVLFRGPRIEDSWQTLVNPGRPLPAFITQLTGITDEMLASAPRLVSVLTDLQTFVGDHPILGHNIAFDLNFLQRSGLFQWNRTIDTYDLASVLLPSAGRYGLAALASALGIPVRTHHRALDDATTTHYVYLRLVDLVEELSPELVEEIVLLGSDVEWGASWLFEQALDNMNADPKRRRQGRASPHFFTSAPEADLEPLVASAEILPLDPEEISAAVEPGGQFAKQFPGYEHRTQQVAMLQAVAQALSESDHLLVEAGTGTGKSMAYLLPAFAWADKNKQRVVISTNTINLQDQLIYKDIPDLRLAMGKEYRASVLKGRSNYLCPRRFAALRRLGPRTRDEMRVLAKLLVWLENGGKGDRSEINLLGPAEAMVWSRLSADSEDCSADTCLRQVGGACPYYKAHVEAQSAHVVIVNHALLLADIATGNRVIPEYQHLIVDEAHHLEAATTRGLSQQATEREVHRLLREIDPRSGGILAKVLRASGSKLSPDLQAQVQRVVEPLASRTGECLELLPRLFGTLSSFMERRRDGQPPGPYGHQERIVPATRTLPDWAEVEAAWEDLRGPMITVAEGLVQLADGLADLEDAGMASAEDLAVATRSIARNLAELHHKLDAIVFESEANMIYWAALQSERDLPSLHAAPLEVGPLVEKYLWHQKESVIMTSATLTAGGEFDYIRHRLSAGDANELALGSPFDYETSTLLYLVDDIPEPSSGPAYQRTLEKGLISLCQATQGRALVLFTSYDHLRRTARAISAPLSNFGTQVFEQGTGASRHSLLESFRTTEKAVLLGTRSFWEGVDVPGEALSVLAIVRLPFDVPSDPIVAARAETYEHPFDEYSLPEAVLRFRQGFGRLIRTRSDRGIVVSFDRRILTKRYGQTFVHSLPHCAVRQGPMAELPSAATRWLGG